MRRVLAAAVGAGGMLLALALLIVVVGVGTPGAMMSVRAAAALGALTLVSGGLVQWATRGWVA